MKHLIATILHRANSYPQWLDKERFYALKQRVLDRYAERDGFDVQYLRGKECYTCDGTGLFTYWSSRDRVTCDRCCGTGWYQSPRWIQLPRYRFGRFVFHSVGPVAYHKEDADSWGEPAGRIDGFVRHTDYTYRQQKRAHVLLGLLFDIQYAKCSLRELMRYWWIVRLLSRRCADCRCRVWSTTRWRCRTCERVRRLVPNEPPF